MPGRPRGGNLVLAELSLSSKQRLRLSHVRLVLGDVLHQAESTNHDVYFPDDCLVSLVVVLERQEGLEIGMVGREGMVGLPVALGFHSSPVRALVRSGGMAMRASASNFHAELRRSPALRRKLSECAYIALAMAMQISECNNRHSLRQRLARWLLMTRDRLLSPELTLTQQHVAQMLGVQREGVTKAAGALRRRKLIAYSRGRIRILDARGLGAAACSCYRAINSLQNQKSRDERLGRSASP